MQLEMIGDLIHDEMYTEKIKRKEGNIYLGLIDAILATTGDGVKKIVNSLPKFNIKRMEIEEIDKNLTRATEVCIYKLYQTDCGEYSLRHLLESGYHATTLEPNAVNNITYAVMSSVSKYMLSSLLYFYDRDFIFFYIRDYIVEKNFRPFLEKVREVYEKPIAEDIVIKNAQEIKKNYNLLASVLLTDTKPNMGRFNEYVENIKALIPLVRKDQLREIIERDLRYPIPKFLYDILTDNITDRDRNNMDMSNFVSKLSTTFSKEGLKALYKEYGYKEMIDSTFELKMDTLYEDRKNNNGLDMPIDRLTIDENRLLHKILTFDRLTPEEQLYSDNHSILYNIKLCLTKYLSVGTRCYIDNKKLTVVYNGKTIEHNYLSENLAKDALSPFNVFGEKRDLMEEIFKKDPEKFCANQTVVTRKENSDMILSGKSTMFRNSMEISTHRKKAIHKLKQKFSRDTELIAQVNSMMSGSIDSVRYLNTSWFKPVVMEESKRALLVLAEMEGVVNLVNRRNPLNDKKQ